MVLISRILLSFVLFVLLFNSALFKLLRYFFPGIYIFVKHFFERYGDSHDYLPLWMAVEVMSFGTTLSFFRGLPTTIKQEISGKFEIHDKVLESWLTSLNAVRNICAHHSRLWNRELGYKPIIPVKNLITIMAPKTKAANKRLGT